MTRRQFSTMLASGLVTAPLAGVLLGREQARIAGVRIGSQSYSFRDLRLGPMIEAMSNIGIGHCELWSGHIETWEALGLPRPASSRERMPREPLREWRLGTPLDHFRDIRRRFDAAGVTLTAYNLSIGNDFTDAEITRAFEMCAALGVDVLTISSVPSIAARLDPFAQEHGVTVGFHNHSEARFGFYSPDDFRETIAGRSSRIAFNLDIGHFTGAGFDALPFLDEYHERIVSLHLKDKTKEGDRNVPWGEGDTPIVEVLQRLRDRGWDIPAHIEYEYEGGNAVTEVTKCFEYCRRALT